MSSVVTTTNTPNKRSAHTANTPTMGGIGIFFGVVISTLIQGPAFFLQEMHLVLCGLMVIFLIGLSDDLIAISPYQKLGAQFVAAMFLVAVDIRLTSFYGVFGIYELPDLLSIPFTLLFVVFIINSFNLIDGINGLAGSIILVVSILYGVWFFLIGQVALALLAFAIVGSVSAFLYYNFSPALVFMGDSGSMVLGFFMAILSIQFLENHSLLAQSNYCFAAFPAVAFGLLIIPVFDTLRIFFLRIINGKPPLQADKNHLHHLLVKIGHSHSRTTFTLVGINIGFILFAISFQFIGATFLIIAQLILAIFLTAILVRKVKLSHSPQSKPKKPKRLKRQSSSEHKILRPHNFKLISGSSEELQPRDTEIFEQS